MVDIRYTSWIEYLAVISGIVSVWFSRRESILTYPTGLINTTFYVYLSVKGSLLGEAGVNFYYTIMSIYGWVIWARRDRQHQPIIKITHSDKRWLTWQLIFFSSFFILIFLLLTYFKRSFSPGIIPWADALASASAFTGMWLMTKKKVESWYWWLLTNLSAIPLYFVKHYVFTSVYYLVLLVMAVFGLIEWRRRANLAKSSG
jgi:nicotinamide mononucleotide transporter